MTVRWKVYDLGLSKYTSPPLKPRYFTAGIDDIYPHWTPDHKLTLDVAQRIVAWKNSWENLRPPSPRP